MLVDVFKSRAEKWTGAIKQALIDRNANASMNASNSLEYTYNTEGLTIRGARYFEFIEYGRKPGKMPPISAISKWIDDKGLQRTKFFNEYSIAYNMGRKGSRQFILGKPRGIFDFLNDAELTELSNEIASAVVERVTSEVLRPFTVR